jgi:hypothetical protein
MPLNGLVESTDHARKRFRKHPCKDQTCDKTNDYICDHAEHDEMSAASKAPGLCEWERNPKRDTEIATRLFGDVIAVHVRRDK